MTPETCYTDVVVIGGGCGGVFLARALDRQRLSCTIVDTNPYSSYASTRNQGWLQSGALYAMAEDDDAAASCRAGYDTLIVEHPDALVDGTSEGYFLFATADQRNENVEKCHVAGLTEVTAVDFTEAQTRNPILSKVGALPFAMAVRDRPFDTRKILSNLINASTTGIAYRAVDHISADDVTQTIDGWRLLIGHEYVTCSALVLACGARIADILADVRPGNSINLTTTKVAVLVLQAADTRLANTLLVAPKHERGPNVVPFGLGESGELAGVSVALYGADVHAQDPSDTDVLEDALLGFTLKLKQVYPGLVDIAQNVDIHAHLYGCQKIQESFGAEEVSRRPIVILSDDPRLASGTGSPLFVVYPGKFTAAPLVAQQAAEAIAARIGGSEIGRSRRPSRAYTPDVAQQRYYRQPDYVLAATSNEQLELVLLSHDRNS